MKLLVLIFALVSLVFGTDAYMQHALNATSCNSTLPEVMIRNLGGSLSFEVKKSIPSTQNVHIFVLPNSDNNVEDLGTLLGTRGICSTAGSYWTTSQPSTCEKQSTGIISFSGLASNCSISPINTNNFAQYSGQLRVVQVDQDGFNEKHFKYWFNMNVQTRLAIVQSFQVLGSTDLTFKLLLQIYRTQQHALYIRFQTVSFYPGANPVVSSLAQANNVQSVQFVEESRTCNGNETCTQTFGMTLFMIPLSCFVQGDLPIVFQDKFTNDTVGTVNLELASENVCTSFNEQATFNGTLATFKAGTPASTFTVGDRVSARFDLQSQFPIQSALVETVILCATNDPAVQSCSTAQAPQLLKSTYYMINQMSQLPNTVFNSNLKQVDFDLLLSTVYAGRTTNTTRHIVEVQVRATLGDLQQDRAESALVKDSMQNTFAATASLTNNLNVVVGSASSIGKAVFSTLFLAMLTLFLM